MNKTSRFLIAGLIIAWAFDLFFYKQPFGIAFSIWIWLALVILFAIGATEKVKPAQPTIILSFFTALIAIGPLFRVEPFTRIISAITALIGLMVVAATYKNGYWVWFRLVDYLTQFFTFLGAAFSRGLNLIFPPKEKISDDLTDEEKAGNSRKNRKNHMVWSIFRGVGLALPIIFIFSALFAAADPIFEDRLQQFLDIFKIENLVEYIFRFFYILLFAYIFCGVLLHAIFPERKLEKPDPTKPWIKTFLGNIETSVILSSVNILFFSFLLIQFRYFFGGKSNISLSGFTYSEYARRGFGELIAVAVISLLLYLALHGITTNHSINHTIRFSILSSLLFIQVLIILFSSFQRLMLYESAYGFSRLRTYSTIFIPWLAFIIVSVVILEFLKKQGFFSLVLVISVLGFAGSLILFNVDSFIATKNIQRARISNQEGYALDYNYLNQLSNDALPVILDAYLNEDNGIKDSSAAFLVCRLDSLSNPSSRQTWQGFNLADQTANKLLDQNKSTLQKYDISKVTEYGTKVVTIGTKEYNCNPENLGFE